MFWIALTFFVYLIPIAINIWGLYIDDANKKWHLMDADLVGMSLLPIFNFFFAMHNTTVIFSDFKKTYLYYNEILICQSCKIYSRHGRALMASIKGRYLTCPECGEYNTMCSSNQSHKLKIEDSPRLGWFDIYDLKRGSHINYNENLMREQEERKRELRKKKQED